MKSFSITSKKHGTFEIFVDDEDFDNVMRYRWHITRPSKRGMFYAQRFHRRDGKRTQQLLHRFLLGLIDSKIFVDHVDGNGLNNQRSTNLRIATSKQNLYNRGKNKNNASGYKGVYWCKNIRKFKAGIKFDGKGIHLGYFDTSEGASKAYESKAKELFGEFYKKIP